MGQYLPCSGLPSTARSSREKFKSSWRASAAGVVRTKTDDLVAPPLAATAIQGSLGPRVEPNSRRSS